MTTMEISGGMTPIHPASAAYSLPEQRPPSEQEAVFYSDGGEIAVVSPLFRPEEDYSIPTKLVQGLGSISCLHSSFRQLEADAAPRVRHTLEVELDDTKHFARITEPETIEDDRGIPTVVLLPGLTEMVDGGTAKSLHDDLAPYFPASRLLSIATDGVGRYCQKIGWKESMKKDFRQMAIARHRLVAALGGGGPVSFVSVSMGSVINSRLLSYNLELARDTYSPLDETDDMPLDIEAVILHSHALVPKSRILPDMIAAFPTHIVRDGRRMHKQLPGKLAGALPVALAYRRSAPAMVGNLKNLMKGASWSDIYEHAEAYPTGIISGETDPLRQQERCLRLASQLPKTVQLNILPGNGHAACLDSKQAARDIADMHDSLTKRF